MINFLAAIGIGLVIGLIGGFVLRGKQPNAIWLAPALALAGSLLASVLALIFGEPSYGWKEPILQVVLAVAGVGVVAFLGLRTSASTAAN
jgi:uncharacterized membrane protein YeaQ/YmgE (transglycosylase-associated protein family)